MLIPEAHKICYDRVRYLIRTRVRDLAKRDRNVFKSLAMWDQFFVSEGWNTLAPTIADSPDFLFCFQSPWQKEMMQKYGHSMLFIDSTHNSVSNYFLSDSHKISLYTVMIRCPVLGKGLPVCFAFTASLAKEPVTDIMSWLRASTGLVPFAVMSDCALAIKWAVQHTYEDIGTVAPKHYWCLFHVLKAFKGQATAYVKELADLALADFRTVLFAEDYPESRMGLFLHKWHKIKPEFAHYVQAQWHKNIKHWSYFFRTTAHQGMHTNNYTEAWHKLLKSRYIPPPEKRRIDEVVKIFCDEVEPAYRNQLSRVEGGFQSQGVSQFQSPQKKKADEYTPGFLELLGVVIYSYPGHYVMSSWTNPVLISYFVHFHDPAASFKGRITSCSCPFFLRFGSACKHMYYLAKHTDRLVVEIAVDRGTMHNEDDDDDIQVLSINNTDNDEIQVISNGTQSPKSLRRMQSVGGISPHSHAKKRSRADMESLPDEFASSHHNLAMQFTTSSYPPLTTLTSSTGPLPNNLSAEEDSDVELADGIHPTKRSLAAGIKALGRASDGLKAKKCRLKMKSNVSVVVMNQFKETAQQLVKMIEKHCSGVVGTLPTSLLGIDSTATMNRKEIDYLMTQLQDAAISSLKRANELLKNAKHRSSFALDTTESTMVRFKDLCFQLVDMLEDAEVLVARKQVR